VDSGYILPSAGTPFEKDNGTRLNLSGLIS